MKLQIWKNGYDPYNETNKTQLLNLHYTVVNNFTIQSFDGEKLSGLTYTQQQSRIISLSNIMKQQLGDIWYNLFYNINSIHKLPKYQRLRCLIFDDNEQVYFDGMVIRNTVEYDPYTKITAFSLQDMLGVFFNWIETVNIKANQSGTITITGQSTLYDSNAGIGPFNYLNYQYYPQSFTQNIQQLGQIDNSFKLSQLTYLFKVFNNMSFVWQNKVHNGQSNYWDIDGNIVSSITMPNQYRVQQLSKQYNVMSALQNMDISPIYVFYNKKSYPVENITKFFMLTLLRCYANGHVSYICVPHVICVNARTGASWEQFIQMDSYYYNWDIYLRTQVTVQTQFLGDNVLDGYLYIPTQQNIDDDNVLQQAYQWLSNAMRGSVYNQYGIMFDSWTVYSNSFTATDTQIIQTILGPKTNNVSLDVDIEIKLSNTSTTTNPYINYDIYKRILSKKTIVNGYVVFNNVFLKRIDTNIKELLKQLLLFSNYYIKYNKYNNFTLQTKQINQTQNPIFDLSEYNRSIVKGVQLSIQANMPFFTIYNPQQIDVQINEDAQIQQSLLYFYQNVLYEKFTISIDLSIATIYELKLGDTVLLNGITYKIYQLDYYNGLYKLTLYGNGYNVQ